MAKILIVDDVAINRALIVTLLGYQGHEIIEAADGQEAVACVRAEHPALVISDILMPTMDGFEFVRQLRGDPDIAHTAVVFYTAHYHQREARQLAEACGVVRVLLKPCEPEEILDCVNAVLDARPPLPALTGFAEHQATFDSNHVRLITDQLSRQSGELDSACARLAALNELNLQLASEHDLPALLQTVCTAARELFGAKYAVLMVKAAEIESPHVFKTSGIGPTYRFIRPHFDDQPQQQVVADGTSLRLANLNGDPGAAGLPRVYPPAYAALMAPIRSLTVTYGWVCLVDKIGAAEFSAEDERLLTTMAAQAGRIYENGVLLVQLRSKTEQLLLEMTEREHATAELRESERRFSQMLGNARLVSVMLDTAAHITYCNDHFLYLTGWSRHEVLGRDWCDLFIPPESTEWDNHFAALLHDDSIAWHHDSDILTRSGARRRVRWNNSLLRNAAGEATGTASIGEDITDRKLAQEKVDNLNRVLSLVSGINSLIIRTIDRGELLTEACRLAIEHGRFKYVRIALLDSRTGEISATAGEVAMGGEDSASAPPFRYAAERNDLVALALESQRPAICNDLYSDGRTMPQRELMLAHGYRSLVALPLIVNGESIGSVVLITGDVGFFTDAEMRVLQDLSADVSFALNHIEKIERLNYLAYYDEMTGLANRTFFAARLTQFAQAAERSGTRFALVIADSRRFESINESFGRQVGDLALTHVAERLAEAVGKEDQVARIGPYQFAAVVLDVHQDADVDRRIEALRTRWLGEPFLIGGTELRLSARMGIALFPDDGIDGETLLRNAESAWRRAQLGDTAELFYTQDVGHHIANELAFEQKLRRALLNGEFVLHYQPKVDLGARRVTGLEALIRWQSPELGLVLPGQFIPMMEETGIIIEVGAWVLRQAIADRIQWLAQGISAPRVAVNLSTVQLRKHDFLETVAGILKTGGIGAGIDFEITESVIIKDASDNIAKLEAMRDLGVSIAIDDFGTGYSSLSYLTKLPVEILKIDRSFTSAMLDDPAIMTLVSTMITLGHSLQLTVIAEGVESEEQAKILRLLRCDQMQGYLNSKPLTFVDMTTYLRKHLDPVSIAS